MHRKQTSQGVAQILEKASHHVTRWAGSTWAVALAALTVIGWLLSGPLFGFSDTWQLAINTGTTIVTFLMVFLIQRSQNKEALAVQLKLNEIVAALKGASNRLVDVESLSEEELAVLHKHYHELATRSRADSDIRQSHSIDEAQARHERKTSSGGKPKSQ